MKKKLKNISFKILDIRLKPFKSYRHKVSKSLSLPVSLSPFLLLSLILLSCSDPKLENPFDPESTYNTTPMSGELTLTQLTDSEVKLQWQLNNTIVGNYIIKRQINSGSYELLATVDKDTNTYDDTGLLTTNTYHYQVIGANGDVQTEPLSNTIQPSFADITNFNIQQENIFTAKLTWQHYCNYEEGYIIERQEISSRENALYKKGTELPFRRGEVRHLPDRGVIHNEKKIHKNNRTSRDFIQLADLPVNTFEYVDDTLLPNHTYEYRIHAYSNLNESSTEQSQKFMEFPVPTNLEITQDNVHTFTLNWTDNIEGEEGFTIERKIDDGNYQQIGNNVENDTIFVDDINSDDQFDTVYYRISAFYQAESSGYLEGGYSIGFPAPTNLTYDQLTVTSIVLNWDDNSEGEDGLIIDKKVGTNAWQIEYATVTENDTTWTDTNAEINEDLQYRVYAYSGSNQSTSIETGVIDNTFPAPTNLTYDQLTITTIELSWDDNSNGEDGFKIDKKVGTNTWQIGFATVAEDIETWTDANAEINEDLQYRVYAYSGSNQSTSIETGVIDNTFPAPTDLTYTLENISYPTADIHLDWDYSMTGIDGFKVKKNGTLLSDVIPAGTTEWTDIGANIENSNSYQVLAFYQSYNSGYSNEVIAIINCTDYDGNVYDIVFIGDQFWMAENLKVTHYRNGDAIQHEINNSSWTNLSTGAYCYYNNDINNSETYGALYNWFAVEEDDTRGLAPDGWHIPTDEEIMILEMELGMSYDEAHNTGWRGTNEGSKLAGNAALWIGGDLVNDPEFGSSGFDFLPGGYRSYTNGYFYDLGYYGLFWSATEYNPNYAWYRTLNYGSTQVSRSHYDKRGGFSVRCVRD